MNPLKLIIIDHEPYAFYKRGYFYLDEFKSNGFEVEFWSIWEALSYSRNLHYHHIETDSEVTYINSYGDLIEKVKALAPGTFVCAELWLNWATFSLARVLQNQKLKIFSINQYHNLTSIHKKALFTQLQDLTFKRFVKKLNYSLFLLVKKSLKINLASLVFLTGNKVDASFNNVETCSITYFDVEQFKKAQNKPKLITEKYIVFLDAYLASHPDIARSGKTSISPTLYYQKLNKAFDEIERQTGYKIIIAAHPKARYDKEFENRAVISGKTAELILNCEMVLDSLSLSVNYAVQANKKVYMIFFNEFINARGFLNDVYNGMKNFSSILNVEMINLDDDFTLSVDDNIDFEAYENFKVEYLYAKAYPKPNFEIIKDAISTL